MSSHTIIAGHDPASARSRYSAAVPTVRLMLLARYLLSIDRYITVLDTRLPRHLSSLTVGADRYRREEGRNLIK